MVPVFSFGETDLFNQLYGPEGSFFRRLQHYIRKSIGLAPVIFSGRGFFQYSFGLIPKRAPISVVGKISFIYSQLAHIRAHNANCARTLDVSLFSLVQKCTFFFISVGSPIELPKIAEPTADQINEHHEKFVQQLIELFETQKHNYLKNPEKAVLELDV